ncbi:MAG: 3-hydroxyacyl-ACP dehydratase FabZ family protein [Phycisphaerae bacterium]
MPPAAIIDPSSLDCSKIIVDREAIMRTNPQRHEFQLLDAIVHDDRSTSTFAGFHDVKPDAWWCRGHIPGRPLFPGVLMIESAAQLASYFYHQCYPEVGFLGFAGVDAVKFRGAVLPPARFLLVGRGLSVKPRRVIIELQGFVDNQMVFEGVITGMPV